MWVTVLDRFLIPYRLRFLKELNNVLVGILHRHSREILHVIREPSAHGDGTRERFDAVGLEHTVIVLAKRGSLMDNPCAFICSHVIVSHHHKRPSLRFRFKILKQRHVFLAQQVGTFQAGFNRQLVRGAIFFKACFR